MCHCTLIAISFEPGDVAVFGFLSFSPKDTTKNETIRIPMVNGSERKEKKTL